ncbi:MAG: phosphate starvation-inducible protein PhoH [Deltaproteobacteria bacterium RIFCSPLOWO2_02_FULL_44_10]|nr:MAG: phosphate starvation-inducible protein PhoH [Deltaproteobacteria bacterium RIFCSPHIGHO2_02_FULL_44_16]OGQ46831.1 MAG: phosphate starvation-inducible protein PhoH [Deltaproteobacteria bacterium RIFCSPLOWO2_02_FULL_44_10]
MTDADKVIHLNFEDNNVARDLFGTEDKHLKSLERMLGIDIHVRGNDLRIEGGHGDVETGERILNKLYGLLKRGYPILGSEIENALSLLSRDVNLDIESLLSDSIFLPAKRRAIVPRSTGQKLYIDAIRKNDIVFCIGPAGTGKTYLAVAMAVTALLRKEYKRIVLARPAVEAGEKLGFLPGDMQAKVNPYLRPIYDALYDMLEVERVEELIQSDVIEIAPIAFMRGRTLHKAFVILDEAQNCNYHQMKMCLTRLGTDSKMVITGDVTQIDLPQTVRSGLLEAQRILHHEPGLIFHELKSSDVVRHPLVQRIVEAYQRHEKPHA